MATFRIPIEPGDADFTLEAQIKSTVFSFRFRFNARESKWYMDIFDASTGDGVRNGIKLVANYPLLRNFTGSNRPQALFFALDTESSDQGLDPETLDDLGGRVKVVYDEFIRDFPA